MLTPKTVVVTVGPSRHENYTFVPGRGRSDQITALGGGAAVQVTHAAAVATYIRIDIITYIYH